MPESSAGILVTGANGHLGRRLVARLAEREPGRPVRAVVRSERAAEMLEALPEEARPEIQILDYSDLAAMESAAKGCSGIVHLVGIIAESASSRYRAAHEDTCTVLASAAANAGAERIVYMSILGSHPGAANACLASKGRAERILLEGPVPAVILRVPMVLGKGDIASKALAGQARAAVLPLIRGGATLQQPIDAGDVVDAIVAALSRPGLENAGLDLGGTECLTHRALVERAARLLGRRPTVVPIPLFAVRAFAAVIARLSANPPITPAMLGVLQHDDQVDPTEACTRLGIELTPLDETLRRCVGPSGVPA